MTAFLYVRLVGLCALRVLTSGVSPGTCVLYMHSVSHVLWRGQCSAGDTVPACAVH